MTNEAIESRLFELVRTERRITVEILSLLQLATERKLHLQQGYPTLFDWLVKKFGYSQGAAYRRIQAARLVEKVPGAAEKLSSGALSLHALAQTQSAIQMEEKRTGKEFEPSAVQSILESVTEAGPSRTEETLAEQFPERNSRQKISLSAETVTALKEAKNFLSHRLPRAGIGEVVHWLAENFLATQCGTGPVSRSVRAQVLRRDQRRCQYQDPVTGRFCHSRYQIEIDHIQPKALGGQDTLENLRCLCRAHNQYRAELTFGKPPHKTKKSIEKE